MYHICLLILVGAPSATAVLQHGTPFLSPLKAVRPYIVSTHSVWPPSDCPRLRFMLNAWLHVRVINFGIVLYCTVLYCIGRCALAWLIGLWFCVPLDTRYVISETFPKPIGMEKLNLTQRKHTLTNEKKCTTAQNKHEDLKPDLVASYDIRPENGEGLFWFRRFINLSRTYLLRDLPTYSRGSTRGTCRGERSRKIGYVQSLERGSRGDSAFDDFVMTSPEGSK